MGAEVSCAGSEIMTQMHENFCTPIRCSLRASDQEGSLCTRYIYRITRLCYFAIIEVSSLRYLQYFPE